RDWDVAAGAPPLSGNGRPPHLVNVAPGAVDDPPLASRRPPDCKIGPPVVVVIGGHRDVAAITPLLCGDPAEVRVEDPPRAGGRPPDGEVASPVAVVIAGYGDVAAFTPLLNGDSRPPHSVKVAFG